jgi:hypothetical protein
MNARLSRSASVRRVFLVEDDHHHTLRGNEAMLVTAPETDADDLLRLPGLFRLWELEQIVEAGNDYRIEDAGTASDGTPLFAVYRRQPDEPICRSARRRNCAAPGGS